jgi:membrane protein
MKIRFKGLGTIFKNTVKGWNADDPFRQSATIAYYAIFSLPALLVLIINVAGLFFGKEAVAGEISTQVEGIMGEETARQVSDIVAKAGTIKAGVISTILAIATIIFGATGVFVQLQKTLNQIWDVRQKQTKGFMKMLKTRLFSFGLILSIGFLLLMSLVISSVLAAFSEWLQVRFADVVAYLFVALDILVSLVVITILFALMFKVLPDVKMKWRDVMIGSFLTSVLFILGKYALSIYFGKADPASAYGAAGSVVLILLWVSYSSMIVFFGAEFTKQYAVYHGHEILPTEAAEKIEETDSLEEEHNAAKEKAASDKR